MKRDAELLARSKSVTDALYKSGFSSESWFVEECMDEIHHLQAELLEMRAFIEDVEMKAHTAWKKKARQLLDRLADFGKD